MLLLWAGWIGNDGMVRIHWISSQWDIDGDFASGAVVFQGHGIGAAITTHHTNLGKPLLCSPPQERQVCGKMISYIQLDAAVKKHMYTEAKIHHFSIPPPLLLLSSSLLSPPPFPPPPPALTPTPYGVQVGTVAGPVGV